MKKLVLTYGIISGTIIISSIIVSLAVANMDDSFQALEWFGYLVMILALSVIFMGIKKYRDEELGGVIKFWTAFKVGIGITLVASLIYVVAWEVNLSVTDHSFIEEYTASQIASKEEAGASAAEIEQVTQEMEELKSRYANPLIRLPITFSEIFPVGLLITLIAGAVLQNSKVLPARTEV